MNFINRIISIVKETFYYSYSNRDQFQPIKKEQEYINFNVYDKTIVIKNDIVYANYNDNYNDNDNNKSLIIQNENNDIV
jgi:hypothetical protein